MKLKSLLFNVSLFSGLTLLTHSSANLTNVTTQGQQSDFENIFSQSTQAQWDYTKSWLNQAQLVKEKLEQQEKDERFNNEKNFARGIDITTWNGTVLSVWFTKARLGNVATIIGATSGSVVFLLTVLAAILIAGAAIALGIIAALIGAILGINVAVIMTKVNNEYKYGAFFKLELITSILSPIALETELFTSFREQSEQETKETLISKHDGMHFDTEDHDTAHWIEDKNLKGIMRSYWSVDKSEANNFIGVSDIGTFTRHNHIYAVDRLNHVSLGFRDINDNVFKLQNADFNKFILKYFQDKSNDYLFFYLRRFNESSYELIIGGTKFKENHTIKHKNWKKFNVELTGDVKDITFDLSLNLSE